MGYPIWKDTDTQSAYPIWKGTGYLKPLFDIAELKYPVSFSNLERYKYPNWILMRLPKKETALGVVLRRIERLAQREILKLATY